MTFEAGRVSTDHRIFDVTDANGDRLVIRQYTGPDGFTVYIRGADSLVVGLELTVDQARALAKVLTEASPTVEEQSMGASESRTYVSLDSAAKYLGVSEKTIRRHISSGRLPAYRIDRRLIRIRREDLDALLRPIPTAGGTAA